MIIKAATHTDCRLFELERLPKTSVATIAWAEGTQPTVIHTPALQ
jgi:hypothetical protein